MTTTSATTIATTIAAKAAATTITRSPPNKNVANFYYCFVPLAYEICLNIMRTTERLMLF